MDSDWANFPKHLLDSVLEILVEDFPGFSQQSDYLCVSVVCESWNHVAIDKQDKVDRNACPMLLIPSTREGTWNIYDPMNDNILNSKLNLLANLRFCGYSKGWLIASDETDLVVSLINPSFMVQGTKQRENSKIDLPPLDSRYVAQLWDFVIKATISADPIIDAHDCVVVIIYEGAAQLAFIRLKTDTTWTYLNDDPRRPCIEDVMHVEGKLYAIDFLSRLLSFDITSTQLVSIKVLVAQEMRFEDDIVRAYLVRLNEKELLMVQRFLIFSNGTRTTTKVRIFALDSDKCEWIEKKTLGNVALFIGDNFSIHAGLASNVPGWQANCIYFNHDHARYFKYPEDDVVRDFCVYDVENQTFSRPYTGDVKTLMEKATQPPIWIARTF